MELKKLDSSFYTENPQVIQALDFDMETNSWIGGDKVRGHGIVKIETNGLIFAIPVRSRLTHKDSFIILPSKDQNKNIKGMGLDYSKAMLIKDNKYISNENFYLKKKQAIKKLVGKEDHITRQFTKYVEKYVSAMENSDHFALRSYKFSTLQNYHKELGLH